MNENENYSTSIQKQLDAAGLSDVKATVGSFIQGEKIQYEVQLDCADETLISTARSLLKLDQ